jgi:methyl acetate hydrolase
MLMVDTKRIEAALRKAADSGDVPGVAAAAATKSGVIFEGGYGKRDLNTGAAMTADTVVWIASMTKAITGACALQQIERGKLALDASIKTVCRSSPNPRFSKASTPTAARR